MASPAGYCVRGEPGCPEVQTPDVLASSFNAAGETFVRQFASAFTPEDSDSVNANVLSAILVILSLVLSYLLLKLTTYYITLGFLSVVTLLHYWFGSKWCLDAILALFSNLYTFLITSAQYPKVSAIAVLGNVNEFYAITLLSIKSFFIFV